jgi:cyclopropane fatty-acyl-phospholipid synthase-like methyltransferase
MIKNLVRLLKHRVKSLTLSKAESRHSLVGPAELWNMKRDFQVGFLKKAGLLPHHYLLDIGCGTLRGGIPLIAHLQDGHYFGIEARADVLDEGREELRDAGLEGRRPTLLASPDMSQLNLDQKFSFIWAFSVLIHLSDDILNETLNFVSRHLADEGTFFANVNVGSHQEGSWQGFPVVWRSLDFYADMCLKNKLAVSDLGPLKDLGHVSNVESQDIQRMLRVSHT